MIMNPNCPKKVMILFSVCPSGTLPMAETSWFHQYKSTKQQKRIAEQEQQMLKLQYANLSA
jgi:hypothetical protein